METEKIYSAVGEDKIRRLVAAFYSQVPADDVLGPMYPSGDIPGAEERLRDFLLFRFGGPGDYLSKRGHPRLRMRHMPFRVDQRSRDRWVQLMTNALNETDFPPDARDAVLAFFSSTATFLINSAE